jgi:hypothetical protein
MFSPRPPRPHFTCLPPPLLPVIDRSPRHHPCLPRHRSRHLGRTQRCPVAHASPVTRCFSPSRPTPSSSAPTAVPSSPPPPHFSVFLHSALQIPHSASNQHRTGSIRGSIEQGVNILDLGQQKCRRQGLLKQSVSDARKVLTSSDDPREGHQRACNIPKSRVK